LSGRKGTKVERDLGVRAARRSDSIRDRDYRKLYGITLSEYNDLLESQGGACAVCGLPPRNETLSVEHNHRTGKVRGLVHKYCNNAVGIIEGPLYESVLRYLGLN
jgi:hypothetical protein